jgi:hypothetical protein
MLKTSKRVAKVKNLQIYIYIILVLSILFVSKTEHIDWRFSDHSNLVIKKNGTELSFDRIKHEKNKINFQDGKNRKNILVVGDSHALDGLNSLKNYKFYNNHTEIGYRFLDDECLSLFFQDKKVNQLLKKDKPEKHTQCALDSLNFKNSILLDKAHVVVYSSEWKRENLKYIKPFFDYLEKINKRGVLLGPNALFSVRPGDILARSSSIKEANRLAFRYLDKEIVLLDKIMQKISNKNKIKFYSKIDSICFNNECELIFKDNMLSFLDYTHWTYTGAERFGRRIFDSTLLAN